MDARQRSQTYYGYAFESYCTSDTPTRDVSTSGPRPDAPPGWGGYVNTNVQWCSVVRTKLGDMRMIIGGEVDCVRGAPQLAATISSSLTLGVYQENTRGKLIPSWN